jgi:lysyl endopeptidase
MRYYLLTFSLVMSVSITMRGQVQVRTTDPSSISSIIPFYSTGLVSNTPVVTVPWTRPPVDQGAGAPQNMGLDSAYDSTDDSTYYSNKYFDQGRVIPTNFTFSNGAWQTTSYGNVWTIKISIDNALSTSLRFESMSLSPTASLYIVNGDLNMVKGPFTAAILPSGVFGTYPMNASSCYIFLLETSPGNMTSDALVVNSVVGGVQPVDGLAPTDGGGGSSSRVSNNCIPSIRCYNDWMLTGRAVALWSNGDGHACSGTLVNNEMNDGTPYFYSAHHCLPTDLANLKYAAFQFQYWQTGCNTGIDQKGAEFFGGATLLVNVFTGGGDEILLKLNNGPGVGDGMTYAAWNRNDGAPSQSGSAIIHHPEAGDMRFTKTKAVRTYLFNSNYWKVNYSSGTILHGSSGGGLFNENHEIIGAVRGGLGACWAPFFGDIFGKFYKIWDNQLQQYLAPSSNSVSAPELPVSLISIIGSSTVGCTTGAQTYSTYNLAGCTYNWMTSPNLTVQSGQGTNSVVVFFNTTAQPNDNGWVNVVINDSKGTLPNGRQVSLRKDLVTTNSNPLIGTYSTSSSTKTLQTVNYVSTGNIYVQYQWPGVSNITAALAPGSPSGSGFYAYPGRCSFNIYRIR